MWVSVFEFRVLSFGVLTLGFRVSSFGFRGFEVRGSNDAAPADAAPIRISPPEFRVSGSRFHASVFGFRVSGSAFRASGRCALPSEFFLSQPLSTFGFRVSNSVSLAQCYGLHVSNSRFQVSTLEARTWGRCALPSGFFRPPPLPGCASDSPSLVLTRGTSDAGHVILIVSFRGSSFGFGVSGLGFRVSGFWFWVPGSGFRMLGTPARSRFRSTNHAETPHLNEQIRALPPEKSKS